MLMRVLLIKYRCSNRYFFSTQFYKGLLQVYSTKEHSLLILLHTTKMPNKLSKTNDVETHFGHFNSRVQAFYSKSK